jgi:DNA-binding transcriptional MerR regulator
LERITIAEAAKKLDVTQEAIRARIRRGTIEHDKDESGKTHVYLTEVEAHDQQEYNTVVNGVVNDYITSLKSEIETLRSQTESLKQDREVWQEEAKRKDTIIAQMNQTMGALIHRIPELEAPSETTPEATESSLKDSNTESRGVVPPDQDRPSWWRRIFGS